MEERRGEVAREDKERKTGNAFHDISIFRIILFSVHFWQLKEWLFVGDGKENRSLCFPLLSKSHELYIYLIRI